MGSCWRFEQALAYIQSLILPQPRPYQSRAATALNAIKAILARLDNPQQAGYSIVHITGSKGKGSTALLLERILNAAGLRVGVFTSPHLQHWTERFRVGGQNLSERGFAELVQAIKPAIEAQQALDPYDPPTFFDALTTMGLLLFRQQQVDVAIIEVGLGGRLDSTNIVDPSVCCITSIELEHTDKLGPALTDIAREKAGIIKPGAPVICGPLPAAAQAVIEARAATFDAPVWRYGRDFEVLELQSEPVFSGFGIQQCFSLPLTAPQHRLNAVLAISCALCLKAAPAGQITTAAVKGLRDARLPGRCELISRGPWIVIDGAHTIDSAWVLRRFIDTLPVRRTHWLLSFTSGKQPQAIAQILYRPGDHITITQAEATRSQSATSVAERLRKVLNSDAQVIDDPSTAILSCCDSLAPEELLCVSGSVYLAGLARQRLTEPALAP